MTKSLWFVVGLALGLASLTQAFAAVVPVKAQDETAIYQKLTEIRISKEAELDFEGDINRLARLETKYVEKNLPVLYKSPRMKSVVDRVSKTNYSPASDQQLAVRKRLALRKRLRTSN